MRNVGHDEPHETILAVILYLLWDVCWPKHGPIRVAFHPRIRDCRDPVEILDSFGFLHFSPGV
jgi:hypothetical protein